MAKYLINDVTTYRVGTVEEVEALHEELLNDNTFEKEYKVLDLLINHD